MRESKHAANGTDTALGSWLSIFHNVQLPSPGRSAGPIAALLRKSSKTERSSTKKGYPFHPSKIQAAMKHLALFKRGTFIQCSISQGRLGGKKKKSKLTIKPVSISPLAENTAVSKHCFKDHSRAP